MVRKKASYSSINCCDCEKICERTASAQKRCIDCRIIYTKIRNKARHHNYYWENWVRLRAKRHGLTPEQLLQLYKEQKGCCAVCKKEWPLKKLDIDHDHRCCAGGGSCGKCVRGLLCRAHNKALGLVHDNSEELKAMLVYLEEFDGGLE
jgi:hypothetical protein